MPYPTNAGWLQRYSKISKGDIAAEDEVEEMRGHLRPRQVEPSGGDRVYLRTYVIGIQEKLPTVVPGLVSIDGEPHIFQKITQPQQQ